MSDLVAEIRKTWREITESDGGESGLMRDYRMAADRIEELEAALRPFARLIELLDEHDEIPETSGLVRAFLVADLRRARRALEGKP